ncbi:MAG: 2-oxo-tetronate isomerase, partial [Burkholderiales bacterium]
MPKFAANLSMLFPEIAFLNRFEAAAKAGFTAVEFLFPYEHDAAALRGLLDKHTLKQVLFNLPPGDWDRGERGVAIFPDRKAEFVAGLDRALDYAKTLRCKQLHMMAGVVPSGLPHDEAARTYVGNLRMAATRAKPLGVRLLIEPLNSRDMPGYFLTSAEQARLIIEEVGSDNLFLQMDLYHAQIMGGDLAERTRAHWPLIRHVQIAGVPGRHEPDVGEINYPYLFE